MAGESRVRINHGACIRSGECYYNHPELVRKGDDGDPQLITTDLSTQDLLLHAQDAAEVCPAQAIEVIENQS